ncbi:ABC transporter ATP-binding protein [Pimelobacter simplex]|uniref:ABC transporter ATP-binding protein n=1 Tax=Nocardioides simplex TaxID=2045 RepID=UPI0027DCBB63
MRALADVAFRVQPGTIHSVIGPNGAGKSSLLNVLSGVYRPQQGSVRWGGRELTGLRPDQITRLGVGRCFQNLSRRTDQTVLDSIMLGRHALMRHAVLAHGFALPVARREERVHRERVAEIAEFVDLSRLLHVPVAELSYGHQKKVDLARALASEPRLLLLDEPAAGMSSGEKRQITQLVRSVVASLGTTVLLVEHDMEMVMGLSDRITVLNFGRLISEGTPDEIQEDPAVVDAYLGQPAEDRR